MCFYCLETLICAPWWHDEAICWNSINGIMLLCRYNNNYYYYYYNFPLIWLRQTAQPYIRYTTYNSLPRRAAMTPNTDCHAGQQQQPGLALPRGCRLPETDGAKFFCQHSDQVGLYLASFHQMAPPKRGRTHLIIALLLIYWPRNDERLSWPSWLTCSRRFTHISGHWSAAGQAQDRESSTFHHCAMQPTKLTPN